MMTRSVTAAPLTMGHIDRLTQRVTGVINDCDIKITRPGANREIVISIVGGDTLGGGTIAVAPLIDISDPNARQWPTTCRKHLPQNIVARTEVVMGDPQQLILPNDLHSGLCGGLCGRLRNGLCR